MEDLLDLGRSKFDVATWYTDESIGRVICPESDVSAPCFERFMELRTAVHQHQADVKLRCLYIGMCLWEMERDKLYHYVTPEGKCQGYTNFYDFCKEVFGFEKKFVTQVLAVVKEYCNLDGQLKMPYFNFSYSQLVEMLPIEEKWRLRITPITTCRNIRKLNAYYKEHIPAPSTTVEDDLFLAEQWCKEEKAKANKKKETLSFVPASKHKVPTSGPSESSFDPGDIEDTDDERDVITPEGKGLSYESIRDGLLRQIELLRGVVPSAGFPYCDLFEKTLRAGCPYYRYDGVISKERYDKVFQRTLDLAQEIDELKKAGTVQATKTNSPASGSVALKNEKERKEWLKNYQSWGVWLDVPEVGKKYYRYDFKNGSSLIVEVSVYFYPDWKKADGTYIKSSIVKYAITDKERPVFDEKYGGGVSGITDWLSKHATEI